MRDIGVSRQRAGCSGSRLKPSTNMLEAKNFLPRAIMRPSKSMLASKFWTSFFKILLSHTLKASRTKSPTSMPIGMFQPATCRRESSKDDILPGGEERYFPDRNLIFFASGSSCETLTFSFFQGRSLDLNPFAQHLESYLPSFIDSRISLFGS